MVTITCTVFAQNVIYQATYTNRKHNADSWLDATLYSLAPLFLETLQTTLQHSHFWEFSKKLYISLLEELFQRLIFMLIFLSPNF